MIIHHIALKIKPGNEEAVKGNWEKLIRRFSDNEPNFVCYLYPNSDYSELTIIEFAADMNAYTHHMEEHGRDPEPATAVGELAEVVSFDLCGEVPAEKEKILVSLNADFYKPAHGLFNRTIIRSAEADAGGMIFLIGRARVKPGQEAAHRRLADYFEERMSSNEPNYASYTYPHSDRSEFTVIEMFADTEAFKLHMAEHGREPELMQQMQQTREGIEGQAAKLYGNASPEMEEMVKTYSGKIVRPAQFTASRTIVPKSG